MTNMERILLLCGLLSLHYFGCSAMPGPGPGPGPDRDPTIAQMLLEGIHYMNLTPTTWRTIMADDTDADKDGQLSTMEIDNAIATYMRQLFGILDHDDDGKVTEEELRSLSLDLTGLNKIVDIVIKNFPVKSWLVPFDRNWDGLWDEDDFFLPATPMQGSLPLQEDNASVDVFDGNHTCREATWEGPNFEPCPPPPPISIDPRTLGSLRLVGGKDASSGDIFLGNKGLSCIPTYQSDRNWYRKQGEVICREIGFEGVRYMYTGGKYTHALVPRPDELRIQFRCEGNEQKLIDCPMYQARARGGCQEYDVQGIVCGLDAWANKVTDMDKKAWKHLWNVLFTNQIFLAGFSPLNTEWDNFGRFLFIADVNNDQKITVEEIAIKAKELISIIFNFIDQTQDGFVSVEDFTTLQMTVRPIHKIINKLFDRTGGEVDIRKPTIMGVDIGVDLDLQFGIDMNNDTIINAQDFDLFMERGLGGNKHIKLLPVISRKVDKNQDGKVQRQEIREFIDEMFDKLDTNGDGVMTVEDLYRLMRELGASCLSTLEWQTFIPRWTKAVQTQFKAMMSYFFKRLDEDHNGEIGLKEFQEMHLPCYDGWGRPEDPDLLYCDVWREGNLWHHFWHKIINPESPPSLLVGGLGGGSGDHGPSRGGPSRGGPSRHGPGAHGPNMDRSDGDNGLAEAACRMLT